MGWIIRYIRYHGTRHPTELGEIPRIDALFAQAGSPIPVDVGAQIGRLRLRRKRFSAVCMFIVLTISILGVQVRAPFPWWLTIVLVVATGAFTWRAYKTVTPYGWV